MSTLAERLAQRATDLGQISTLATAKRQSTEPRAHYLRRDGTALCGQQPQPANLGGNLPECPLCTIEFSRIAQQRRGP